MEAYAHQARDRGPEEAPRLSPAASAEVALARGLARVLDEAFTIPGTRKKVGLDVLLGLFPVAGDMLSAAIGSYVIMVGSRLGVPPVVLWRMFLNLAIDTVVGSIPIVGDAFDAGFKANVMNVRLLERALADPVATQRSSRRLVAALAVGVLLILAAGVAGVMYLFRHLGG